MGVASYSSLKERIKNFFISSVTPFDKQLATKSATKNKTKPFLYIHIPKTAGVSIQNSGLVHEQDWQGHTPASKIKDLNYFFSFCFVRNPYARIYSSYNFYKNNLKRGNKTAKQKMKEYENFENFVLNFHKAKKIDKKHYRTQVSYVCNRRKIIIDYVGKFENINNDWLKIQEINPWYNKIIDLPFHNKTPKPETNIYSKKMAEIIFKYYQIDFEMFGYEKDSWKSI